LGDQSEEILDRLDRWDVKKCDIESNLDRWVSDRDYADHVLNVGADTPARFNADPRRLYEASGCAGKRIRRKNLFQSFS
jgi:D-lactate dehydrogenase